MFNNAKFTPITSYPSNSLWRILVDLIDHEKEGPAWMADEEPGYLKSMFNALNFVLETLDTPLSTDHLIDLHAAAVKYTHRKETWLAANPDDSEQEEISVNLELFTTCLRQGYAAEFGLQIMEDQQTNCSKKGVAELLNKLAQGDNYFSIINSDLSIQINTKTIEQFTDVEEVFKLIQGNEFRISTKAASVETIRARIDNIISNFHLEISAAITQENKISAIARCVRDLELTHPFDDGNCRTMAVILLTKLLLQQQLSPAILEYRDKFDAFSINELCEEIKHGMSRFQNKENIEKGNDFFDKNVPLLYLDGNKFITKILAMQLTNDVMSKGEPILIKHGQNGIYKAIETAIQESQLDSLTQVQFLELKRQLPSLIKESIQIPQGNFFTRFFKAAESINAQLLGKTLVATLFENKNYSAQLT